MILCNSINSNSGTTTIYRPHGGGTLVIRKRPPVHQQGSVAYAQRTSSTPAPTRKPTRTTTTTTTQHILNLSENTVPDLDTASSHSTGMSIRQIRNVIDPNSSRNNNNIIIIIVFIRLH